MSTCLTILGIILIFAMGRMGEDKIIIAYFYGPMVSFAQHYKIG